MNWCHVNGQPTNLTWDQLVLATYLKRISLSEHGHYATPGIHFDHTIEKGHPFAYHVYGTAITTVTVDCLRGIYEVDAVRMVHDFGNSMNPVGRSRANRRRTCTGYWLDDDGRDRL